MTAAVPQASSSATSTPSPTVLDDVNAAIAEIEKTSVPAGGSGGTTEPPAAAAQSGEKPAAGASVPPEKKSEAGETPPASGKAIYTNAELAAFEGNYTRPDFDWERVEPTVRERIRVVDSGTGKYRDRLRREHEEKIRELEAAAPKTQPPATATEGNVQPQPVDEAEALEQLLNPQTWDQGLAKLLKTEKGKKVLQNAGFSDQAEREVVGQLVKAKTLQDALMTVAKEFPMFETDVEFSNEVTKEVTGDKRLLAAANNGRSVIDATDAIRTAMTRVLQRRLDGAASKVDARKTALDAREAEIAKREKELQKQIEAANRNEPASPSIKGGGNSAAGGKTAPTTILEDVREALGGGRIVVR